MRETALPDTRGNRTSCIVCGSRPALLPRTWCSKRCRLLLREEARARFPDLEGRAALAAAERWASEYRGIHSEGPLTSRIAARLRTIPKRMTGEATAARQSVAAERFEVPPRGQRGKWEG